MQNAISLRRVEATVRPPRVAVLLPIWEGHNWHHDCERIIELASSIWGGEYWVIVPVPLDEIAPDFQQLLSVYDPDFFVVYRHTGRDLEQIDPESFNRQFEQRTSATGRELGDAARARILAEARSAPLADRAFKTPDEDLLRKYVPFHSGKLVTAERISADHPVRLFPSVLDLTLDVYRPEGAVEGLPHLWTSALLGRWNQPSVEQLYGSGRNVMSYSDQPMTMRAALRASTFGVSTYDGFPPNATLTPFQASRIGTRFIEEDPWRPFADEECWGVVGSTVDDFCLYFLLSRLTGRVFWLPSETSPDVASLLIRAVGNGAEQQEDTSLTFLSRNGEGLSEPIGLAKSLGYDSASTDLAALLEHGIPRRYLIHNDPARTQGLIQFVGGRSSSFFPSPQPVAVKGFVGPKQWLVDCEIEDFRLPRRIGLAEKAFGTIRSWSVRTGKDGLVYSSFDQVVPNRLFSSVKPSHPVQLLSPWEIANHLDGKREVKFTPSDKSTYVDQFIKMAGSVEKAGLLLGRPEMRQMVALFLNEDRRMTSISEYGFLSRGRRYCDIDLLNKIVGGEEETSLLVDVLLDKSFLRRGFVLKCSLCRNTDWYDADAVGQQFRCSRCRQEQVIRQAHWKLKESKDIPTYYALHEIAFQCLNNGCDVTIKLAHWLKKDARSCLFALEADVKGPSTDMQLDVLAIVDGSVVLGECKGGLKPPNRQIKKSLASYATLASRIGADRVIFARVGDDWKDEVKQAGSRMTPPIECIRIPEGSETLQ